MKHCIRGIAVLVVCLAAGPALSQSNFFTGAFCPDQTPLSIEFDLEQDGPIELAIEHIFTEVPVRTLVDAILPAGQHTVFWDGRDDLGQLMDSGLYKVYLRGEGWQVDDLCAIDCGNDISLQSRLVVGGRDVTMVISQAVDDGVSYDLGVYAADGTTLVVDFGTRSGNGGNLSNYWGLEDQLGDPLPAGDYICRLTSAVYNEDIPFSLDPIVRGSLTVTITDGDGQQAMGTSYGAGDPPLIKGSLQQVAVDFGRRMSAPELEYLLGGGLQTHGFLNFAEPLSPTVLTDSTGVVFSGFDLKRSWPDLHGIGDFVGYGMFDPYNSLFQLGYDHQGITWQDGNCQKTGAVDAEDWIVNPGPFFDTPSGSMDPSCPNPVLAGQSAEIYFTLDEPGVVVMYVIDSDGNTVRQLIAGQLVAGQHLIEWDRRDVQGEEVPDGIYRLLWVASRVDGQAIVCSGDIEISSAIAPVPGVGVGVSQPILLANHPNPFNPSTSIGFALPKAGRARITVLSVDGKRVATLLDEPLAHGRHTVVWNGRDREGRAVPSGTYFYRLEAAGTVDTRRMLLLK